MVLAVVVGAAVVVVLSPMAALVGGVLSSARRLKAAKLVAARATPTTIPMSNGLADTGHECMEVAPVAGGGGSRVGS